MGRLMAAPLRPLPDFLIVGAQRAGTTSLFNYLSASPDIYPSAVKEIHFFDNNYAKGRLWYRSFFPLGARSSTKRTGEATPYLLFHPSAPDRVEAVIPDVHVIVLLRNPVDRAYSHYWFTRRRGLEPLRFEEAIEAEAERLEGSEAVAASGVSRAHRQLSYLQRGRYVEQLPRWEGFTTSVVFSERLYRDPQATTERVCDALDARPPDAAVYRTFNEGSYPPMARSVRRRLERHFHPFNLALAQMLGEDPGW
ncbi:MAG: sulfotransferase [Nitriliruptorales bacterium]|nr:sulfotransferase [Nitriliruptorales bacterium]